VATALLRGDANVATGGVGNAQGQLATGDIKVLYVRTAKRIKALPDVPTATEVGLGSYPGSSPWWGIVAPAGVPDAIITKLNGAITASMAEPQIAKFLDDKYLDAVGSSPKEFGDFLKKDREGVAELVKGSKGAAK
jgi:tripartite-type tricarboxylate transporter receptor subunit TctC